MARRVRAMAIVALLLAALAFATVGAVRVDRRYHETRFLVRAVECPLVMVRDEARPECPPASPSYDGT